MIVISGHGNIDTAVRATRLGAYDFLEKPLSLERVLLTVNHALGRPQAARPGARSAAPLHARGAAHRRERADEEARRSRSAAPRRRTAACSSPARTAAARRSSPARCTGSRTRAEQPFIDVNCAAIPEELIESELFGHRKGAFTGAIDDRKGKFELADGGTLFLDEIGDMSLKTQAKVLRVLQEQTFQRSAAQQTIKVDVRVIAATNKNLEAEIANGSFRSDLYYRLNVIPIDVPPLRARGNDIVLARRALPPPLRRGDAARRRRGSPPARRRS